MLQVLPFSLIGNARASVALHGFSDLISLPLPLCHSPFFSDLLVFHHLDFTLSSAWNTLP